MRTISANLIAAQKNVSASKTPYTKLEFTSKDGETVIDYSSRILNLQYNEEPYNEYATIMLRNNDNGVADIEGYWTQMVLGCDATAEGGDADEGGIYPRLWVKGYFDISAPGTKVRVLELEGQWKQMEEKDFILPSTDWGPGPGGGSPPYHDTWYDGVSPIYDIMATVISIAGMHLALLEPSEDDGFISGSHFPIFKINEQPYETFKQIVYRLLEKTKCYLKSEGKEPEIGSKAWFRVIYPQESDEVDETYNSWSGTSELWFTEFAYKTKLVIPNIVYVYCNKDLEVDADGNPVNEETYGKFLNDPVMTGVALDADSIYAYDFVFKMHQAGDIRNQADGNYVAQAILDRAKLESHGGRLVVPHDCRVELYDKVRIYDAR